MKLRTKIYQKDIAIVIIALLLFTNLALFSARYMWAVIVSVGIGALFCACLILQNIKKMRKVMNGFSFIWCVFFALEMFLYGFFGSDKDAYSFSFHMINLIYIFIFLIIFTYFKDNIISIFAEASVITIYLISFFVIYIAGGDVLNKIATNRFGMTAVGNVNTTTISYIFLLIPVVYMLFYKKEKKYLLPTCVGVVFMFLTGSKKAIIAVLIVLMLMMFDKTNDRKKLMNNIVLFIILITAMILFCVYNPYLYNLIGERMIDMFNAFVMYDVNDNSSTSLRMTFIITALTKCWDSPLLGHGWNSFANLYGWNSLYQMNLYTHCNYTEILFSFGLIGFVAYYWFPIFTLNSVKRVKDKGKKLFATIMCFELLFIDIGTVSCYSSILGYVGFIVAYISLSSREK